MAFKNKLLATAAIPLIALAWMEPAFATTLVRPDVPVQAQSLVIKVQSDEELLQQQQKKERREQRKQRNQQEQGAAQDNSQDNSQDAEQPKRRKKNAEAQQEQQIQQQDVQQDNVQDVAPPKRKKKNAEAQDQQMQQQDQSQDTQPVKRKKKNAEAQQEQQIQQDDQQSGDAEQVKPRRKKNADAQDQQMQQDQQQSGDAEQVKPRKKKNADAQQDNANGSIEEIQTEKPKKNADTADEAQSTDKAAADKPERIKKRKEIAADPSKTTDTIELPVANGAAVLDSDKDADKRGGDRERRKREREDSKPARVPKSDKDAQAGFKGDKDKPVRIDPVLEEKGERITGFRGYDYGEGRRVGNKKDDFRVIINIDGRVVVRDDDGGRLGRHGETRYEQLGNGRIREVVIRPDGDRIVTVRNRWGEIIRRSRIDRRDHEVVIFYSPLLEQGRDRLYLRDAGEDLPPMRLRVPLRDYIADVSSEPDRDYEEFLEQPPVEPVERVYSVDEVKYSARIRDKVRRIDLDTVTFETGSAEIDMGQAGSLKRVGAAIKDILDRDPGETFLIEGHTDAVGSDESNLVLSDERAESVANVLSDLFEIPAENLVTQGYGERFLKVDSDGPERLNRRVTIRRITSLVRPIAANEE
jgi:outer membrane protein OmpA-like peptidoglycan-associated protein